MPDAQPRVTVGVDSHKDVHVAAIVDSIGQILATTQIPTTERGYGQLVRWAQGFGQVERFGVEGTGSFAAGLTRYLRERDYQVVEVNRPNRQRRRRQGKSDPVDAEGAARAALSGEASGAPKAANSTVEMIRVLRVARRSASKARTQAANQLDSLVVTAPDELRRQLRTLAPDRLVEVAAAFRPGALTSPVAAAKLALRELARRHQALSAELDRLDRKLIQLTAKAPPSSWPGVASDPRWPVRCWWPRATTPAGCAQRPPLRCCAAPHPWKPPPARSCAIGSTAAVTGRPTMPCG
jgi:transposase